MLGDLNPTWSLKRQSVVVSVLMELLAAGSLPREKLDLDEFINPRPIPFIEWMPQSRVPVAKRLRLSGASAEEGPPLESLEISSPTGRAVPRPAWTQALVSLHNTSDLGRAALLESMLARHGDLAAHPLRHKPNFKFTLWKDAQEALALGNFPSPLASFDNRSGLRASDLLDAFNHMDRCAHFDAPNTNASKNRADIGGELVALKVDNQSKLSKQGMPQTILDLFDPERTIIQMFSRAEDVGRSAAPTPGYCFAGDEDDDPEMGEGGLAAFVSWLRARKLTWMKMRIRKERPLAVAVHKRRRTSRLMNEVSPLPSAVAWIEQHPVNGTAWLTDQGAAILRLLRADGGVSKVRQPVIFGLMYTFFFKL